MPLILPGNVGSATATTGFNVANSARFNDNDGAYLDHTHNAVTSTRKNTFSVWLKRSNLSSYMYIIATRNGTSTNRDGIAFNSNDQLDVRYNAGSTSPIRLTTNRRFRDISAWYHIVVAVDTTQGTDSNRIKVYVNGTQETSFATSNYMSQNYDFALNAKTDQTTDIGNDPRSDGSYFDGYMAEFVALDGSQNAPTDFGEFDEDSPNIWKPKDGLADNLTFGSAGFYMNFQTAAELGTDISGNSNTFSENNLTATDQSTDTCTNNFVTLNPLIHTPNPPTFSEGNLKFVKTSTGVGHGPDTIGTIGAQSGKWYFEMKTVTSTSFYLGMIGDNHNNANSNGDIGGPNIHTVNPDPTFGDAVNNNGTYTSISLSYSANDIFGMAYDLDNGKWYFHINGTYFNSGDPTSGSTGTGSMGNITTGTLFYLPFAGGGSYNHQHTFEFNFGSPPYSISSGNADANGHGNFEYSVPSGYFSLCTKNLAEFG